MILKRMNKKIQVLKVSIKKKLKITSITMSIKTNKMKIKQVKVAISLLKSQISMMKLNRTQLQNQKYQKLPKRIAKVRKNK